MIFLKLWNIGRLEYWDDELGIGWIFYA